MATVEVEITDPKGPQKKTEVIVPGQTIHLSRGIKSYRLGESSLDLYGNAGEKIKFEDDLIITYFNSEDELGSQVVYPVDPVIDVEKLIERIRALEIPEANLEEPDEPTGPGGKRRTRKTKRRRTLRKHK